MSSPHKSTSISGSNHDDIGVPSLSKTRVLGKVVAYGDEWLGNESVGKRENEIAALPTGNQAVPAIEPDWDYNTAKGRWDQSHFIRCILEGLRQARSKSLNYGKLADIEQEEKKAPGRFLDRLREGLRRFTEIDPESEEGKMILKARFLTQSAPDILCKLLKWEWTKSVFRYSVTAGSDSLLW